MKKRRLNWSQGARVVICTSVLGLVPLARAATEEDPWERINRPVFSFNDTVDTYAFKPLAQSYQFVTPTVVQTGIHNFLSNIGDVKNLANNLLQGKLHSAGVDTGRLLMNSTIGLVGLVDVATPMGLKRNDEDFGQTLGHWGVGSGPYVVLPLMGPSTLRDAPARYIDTYAAPYSYMDDIRTRNALYGATLLDGRSQMLKAGKPVTGDKYVFVRNAYLQGREFKIKDGRVEDDF